MNYTSLINFYFIQNKFFNRENTLYNNRKKKYEDYIYKTELKKGIRFLFNFFIKSYNNIKLNKKYF